MDKRRHKLRLAVLIALAFTSAPLFFVTQPASARVVTVAKSVAGLAAYCGGPIQPPTSVSSAGKPLDVVGTYKAGLSDQAITNFEAEKLALRLGRCISYVANTSKGSVHSVHIYASPKQIRLYQGYVVYYLRKTDMFVTVRAKSR